MSHKALLDPDTRLSVLNWAAERKMMLSISVLADGRTCTLRSHLVRFDPDQSVAQIAFPICTSGGGLPEINVGDELGVSFRRSHKKCIFVGTVATRCRDTADDGTTMDMLVIRVPDEIRELQRRAYQRIVVPSEHFIAVKLWQGGVPEGGEASWPLCAGRVRNISMGGLLVDIRCDQNPRLSVGDVVGVEISPIRGTEPIVAEAQYRHCTTTEADRIGLGLQFLGLEHELPNRTPMATVADFVKSVQALTHRGGSSRR